ncbi:DNA-processing protein DprA [Paenibacillus thermoaerophilus]|uniref:DNA-processing protein DprA n=1 Tax=Paenibacillus thermoaerophilus TaxID=1215385 RepID=A0ABW2V0P6_9BACL|nr:DNA-processing protein DprA [Paenibacillus thermoaerophilus]
MSNRSYPPAAGPSEADRRMLIAMHETPGIGRKSIRALMEAMPQGFAAGGLHRASAAELQRYGLSPAKAAAIAGSIAALGGRPPGGRAPRAPAEGGYAVVTIWDDAYPPLLRETADPPLVLYVRGEPDALRLPAVAIVGTRVPTAYGRRAAGDLAEQVARTGIAVASGLARGVDAAAHEGAMRAPGGITVAVMATSIDTVYPPDHRLLARRIVDSGGALVSEYPPGTPPHPGLFPERNRIIAGLSLGTLVVEAAERSGAMITAQHAQSESRALFAVPGPISSPKSEGPHKLIRDGVAKLVASGADIIEELRPGPLAWAMGELPSPSAGGSDARPELSADERRVLDLIEWEPVAFDRILERSGFGFGHLHAVLLSLTMKNVITALPGPSYTRVG